MELTPEMLENVKRMAAAAFSFADIADVLEMPLPEVKCVITDENSELFKAYRSGQLMRQLELRERIFKDARNGSSPAQTIAHKLMEDVIIKNKL